MRATAGRVFLALLLSACACACACRSETSRPPSSGDGDGDAVVHLELGRRYRALERGREASRHLHRALRAYRRLEDRGREARVLLELGRTQLLRERPELALAFLEKAAERDDGIRAEALLDTGEIYLSLGRPARALAAFVEAMRDGLAPAARPRAWFQLARAYRALGDLDRSRRALEASSLGTTREGRVLSVDILIGNGELDRAFETDCGVPLETVQAALEESGTRVLVYTAGEERSLLWSVTGSTFTVYVLPETRVLDRLARDAFESLSGRGGTGSGAIDRAARVLLGPIRDLAHDERWVVVSSGRLGALPFGALPFGDERAPLVSAVEVVRLTSVSELERLRPAPTSFSKWVAVAADPSHGLPAARREARAIEALGPPGAVEIVTGSRASVEWVEGAALEGFRILHLATHGRRDRGLLLGNGFLGRDAVLRLRLAAELVVLSSCDTELARAFLRSGTRRVIASNWSVDDRATAELMKRFYAGVFSGLSPAAALRDAQVSMWKQPRFRAPRFWAAFELHGDWTT